MLWSFCCRLVQASWDVANEIDSLYCGSRQAQGAQRCVCVFLLACAVRWLNLAPRSSLSSGDDDIEPPHLKSKSRQRDIPTPSRACGRTQSPRRQILGPAESSEELQLLVLVNTASPEELRRLSGWAKLDYMDSAIVEKILSARRETTIETLDDLVRIVGIRRAYVVNALLQSLIRS